MQKQVEQHISVSLSPCAASLKPIKSCTSEQNKNKDKRCFLLIREQASSPAPGPLSGDTGSLAGFPVVCELIAAVPGFAAGRAGAGFAQSPSGTGPRGLPRRYVRSLIFLDAQLPLGPT